MKKMTKPTIIFPPATKLPKAETIFPAFPCSKISRVEEMFNANLNKVSSSNSEGKTEISSASLTFIVINKTSNAKEILQAKRMSKRKVGSGIIIITTIRTTANTTYMSLY